MPLPPSMPPVPAHLYVHVPFCTGRCAYCAFYSIPHPDRAGKWLPALARELDLAPQGEAPRPTTVYIGGGTPTSLQEADFAALLDTVAAHIDTGAVREWTVESNPDTLTAQACRLMRDAGVNRISVGAQSFDDRVLAAAGRRHDARSIDTAVATARREGFENIGLDLIAGLPGDTADTWAMSLRRALELRPAHLSVYALSIEEGAPLSVLCASGALAHPTEDEEIRRLDEAEAALAAAGYDHYETSNFALPGRTCLHNLGYWRGRDYLGVGPSAASRWGQRRWTNAPDLEDYQSALAAGRLPPRDEEAVSLVVDRTERLIFGLRLTEGVSLEAAAAGDAALREHWTRTLVRLGSHGLAVTAGDRWTLTPTGRRIADSVAEELIPDR